MAAVVAKAAQFLEDPDEGQALANRLVVQQNSIEPLRPGTTLWSRLARSHSKGVSPDRSTLRTMFRDTCSSRQISLMDFPRTKNPRRIRAIVSTPFIPRPPVLMLDRAVASDDLRGGQPTGQTITVLSLNRDPAYSN
jgi:hypothetical protein